MVIPTEEPFVGLVSEDGYIESYGLEKAKECDYHHQYALSSKGLDYYDKQGTLRFVKYFGDNKYTLEGSPALDPFGVGYNYIRLFAKHCSDLGASLDTAIRIADHKLNTEYEGKEIGTLKDWL